MTKISTSSSKCGSCERIVKNGDKSGIACNNCPLWFQGACSSLSEEDVNLMGRNKGCLWLCDSSLNDVFSSEAKYNPIIKIKISECGMEFIHKSLIEIKSALGPPPEPVKKHDNENSLSPEAIKNALVAKKGTFNSSFEADNSKLQNVVEHRDESTLKVEFTRRLGKPKGETSKTWSLTVHSTSEWDARKHLSKSYKFHNYLLPGTNLHITIAE